MPRTHCADCKKELKSRTEQLGGLCHDCWDHEDAEIERENKQREERERQAIPRWTRQP